MHCLARRGGVWCCRVVESMRMLTRGQSYSLAAGDSIQLDCQFYADSFNLFDYPVVWH